MACALLVSGASAVEFPGPIVFGQFGTSLSVAQVHLPGVDRDYFVSGTGGGFLGLNRYEPSSQLFMVLHRLLVGGMVTSIVPWEEPGAPPPGLVVATSNPDRLLFVRLNSSFPYLVVAAEVPLPEDPGALAFTGVESNGALELMVALPGLDRVLVVGQSGGQWAVVSETAVGDRPSSLVGIDLDGDRIKEMVVAQTGQISRTLGILRYQTDGRYLLETVTLPGLVPALVAAFDVDGDGRLELAVAGADTPVVKFYNETGGALTETGHADLTIIAQSLHLNQLPDGSPGLFVGRESRGLLEFSSFNSGVWQHRETYYPGCLPREFALADIDGDSVDDLIALGGDAELLTVMLGNSRPGFAGVPAVNLEHSPGSFVSDDLDGDGWHDLLIADISETTMSLARGGAGGTLDPIVESLELGFRPGYVLAADLDADPALELAVLDVGAAELVVMDYSAVGELVTRSRTAVGQFPFLIAQGDLDADGVNDLMVLSRDTLEVGVLFGNGDGTMAQSVKLGFENRAHWIVPIDLNADGLLDLAATDALNRVWTLINSGGRQFVDPGFVNAGAGALYMATGDLDGDLDEDLVVANRLDSTLSFFENSGNGGLVLRIGAYDLPGQPAGVALADFDRNGHLDVLLNLKNNESLGFVLGLADWIYSPTLEIAGGPDMTGVDAVDFSSDGVPDILVVDQALRLGLTLLNGKSGQVAVAPTAVVADCRDDGLEIRVRPDRPGPWRLELGQDAVWLEVMSDGRALLGHRDFNAGTWLLSLDQADLAPWLVGGRRSVQARLTVGAGPDLESDVWSLDIGCGVAGQSVAPRISWRREPWPNPFNPEVRARITLAKAGEIEVAVYDLAGHKLAVLATGDYPAGDFEVSWDGATAGRPVSAGMYLLRVKAPGGRLQRKLMLIK